MVLTKRSAASGDENGSDEDEHMAWCSGGRRNSLCGGRSAQTVYNTLKTDTKYSISVRGRPTLKDEERFRNELVRKPYERSFYERTLMIEPFIEKHAISTELSNVKGEKHKLKSHRV